MPITFENDNDVIVYALERVIAYARQTQQIFIAQCVWWLASIVRLERELVSHIDKLQTERNANPQEQLPRETSTIPRDLAEDRRINQVLDDTEQYLRESRRQREIKALKVSGTTSTGRINPTRISQNYLKKSQRVPKVDTTSREGYFSKTEGIESSELSRRKAASECLRCPWPSDRKGNHRVRNCRRQIKLDTGTAEISNKEKYREPVESPEENDSTDSSLPKDNIDWDLWLNAPIVLSEVLLDRLLYPRNTRRSAQRSQELHNLTMLDGAS